MFMKEKCLFCRIVIGLIFFLLAEVVFAQNGNYRLFHIERNKNKNIVCYDLCVRNGAIDAKNPVQGYWINMPEKEREELSSIEKKYAYGWTCKKIDENTYKMTMVAFKKNFIIITYDPKTNTAKACITQNGKEIQLKKIEANTKAPFHVSVNYVNAHGVDKHTGKNTVQKIM